MHRAVIRTFLQAALVLTLSLFCRFAAAVNIADLKPMVIISLNGYDPVMQRASIGFQGAGIPEGYALFQRLVDEMLLVPVLTGMDRQQPIHFFLLRLFF